MIYKFEWTIANVSRRVFYFLVYERVLYAASNVIFGRVLRISEIHFRHVYLIGLRICSSFKRDSNAIDETHGCHAIW